MVSGRSEERRGPAGGKANEPCRFHLIKEWAMMWCLPLFMAPVGCRREADRRSVVLGNCAEL